MMHGVRTVERRTLYLDFQFLKTAAKPFFPPRYQLVYKKIGTAICRAD
jgi:hypothetical protein